MSHRTAVVILNWNTRRFLELFLPDIIKFTGDVADIIVADNASTDDSVDFIRKKFPTVQIILNNTNEGFAGGYNTALSQLEYEYFVLLNSDVRVTENWLLPLLQLMDDHKNIGACQPKILSFHDPDTFEYAGAGGGFIDKYGYPFCRGRIFNSLEKDTGQYNDSIPVFWATGACMMVRSSVYTKLNGLDPVFFAHMEEIDFCWRIHRSGSKVYYCPSSSVYHVGGGTLHKSNARKTYLNFRNNLLMIYKNSSAEESDPIFAMRRILDVLASIIFLFSGSYADFKAVWHARRDFNKLKTRYQRPLEHGNISELKSALIIYPKSILWVYYLCRRRKFSSLDWIKSTSGN